MFTLIKWLFLTLILLLAIAITIPVAATYLIEQDEVKSRITAWFHENTGRRLTIHGEVGFEPGLEIRLFAEDVDLQNPSWARRPLALSTQRAELTIALMPLLRRQLVVNSLLLTGADLWVEYDEAEGSNLKLIDSARSPSEGPRPAPSWFGIKRVDILNSQILAADQRENGVTTVDLFTASLVADQVDLPLKVTADGSINGLPVDLSGSASTLATILTRKPTRIALTLTTPGGDKAIAEGDVADVLLWRGIEAQVQFTLPSIPNLSPLFNSRPMDIRNLSGTALFRQPGTVSSMALENIDAGFDYLELGFSLGGRIGMLSRLDQFALKVDSEQSFVLSKLLPGLTTTKPDSLNTALSTKLDITGNSKKTRVDITHFELVLGNTTANTTGGFFIERGDWSDSVQVDLSIADLVSAGHRLDLSLPEVGPVKLSGLLKRTDQHFDLSDIRVKNFSDDVSFAATGNLEKLGANIDGTINFDANADAAFFLQSFFDLPLSPSSAVAVGRVDFREGELPIKLDSFTVVMPGGVLTGEGVVADLSSGSDVQLKLDALVNDWPALSEAMDKELPDFKEGQISAVLTGQIGGKYALNDIEGKTTDAESGVRISGSLQQLGETMRGDLDFTVKLPQTQVKEILSGPDFVDSFVSQEELVNASGKLTGTSEGLWLLNNLSIRSRFLGAELQVEGELTQLSPPDGTLSVSLVGDIDQNKFPENPFLPPLDTVDLEFSVPIENGEVTVEDLHGVFNSTQGNLQLSSKNALSKNGVVGVFDALLELPDIKQAVPVMSSFREDVPLSADLEIKVENKRWQVQSLLRAGNNDFDGTIIYDFSEQRPKLEIRGTSKVLDVDSLLIPAPKEDRFFSEISMVPNWMNRFDGEIKLDADRFSNNAFDLDKFSTLIRFQEQSVSVQLSAGRGEGTLSGNVEFPADTDSRIAIVSSNLPITAFRSLIRREIFQGGVINMNIDLKGPGDNLAEILSGGSGEVEFDINNSSIKGSALDSVGGDIFSNLLRVFNPFIKKDKLVNLECGAINFDLIDGKAVTRNGLAMKTDRVTLLGAGEITIPNEGLKLEIAPKPRKGFGISASSFAKMIRLGGTLSKPDVEASATGFFKSGAAIGAAIFSGGLSLIGQGLLDRLTANDDVCALARGEVEKPSESFDDVRDR